jgi:hypothetical protein
MSGFSMVEPVNRKKAHGDYYKDRYDYNKIHVDEIPSDLSVPGGVRFRKFGGVVAWKYRSKPTVVITKDGPFVLYTKLGEETRNQAYFALSVLADKGYVSGWRKK